MPVTIKDVFETHIANALNKNPQLAKDINAVVHFDIAGASGGQWTLDLTKEKDFVAGGLAGTPAMIFSTKDEDFLAIVSGKLNGQMAVMTGKLKFKPMNIALASKLGKILSAGRGS